MRSFLLSIVIAVASLAVCPDIKSENNSELPCYTRGDELSSLFLIDKLPSYRRGTVEQISSYDRSGGNDDGASGKYSYIRKEGDKLVLADLKGPGVINRIWVPNVITDTVEFYFDGEAQPRIRSRFEDLFNNSLEVFPHPLCSNAAGGYYCYSPIPYRKSCKVLFCGEEMHWFQIQYRNLDGMSVETFTPTFSVSEKTLISQICEKWGNLHPIMDDYASGKNTPYNFEEKSFVLMPGESKDFFQRDVGGRICGLELEIGTALDGKYKDVVISARWDDDTEYAINAPAADFFGYAYGKPSMRGMLIGSISGRCYSYIPAPYDSKAVLSLRYELREGIKQYPVQITTRVFFNDAARDKDSEGRLYTNWRREKDCEKGKYYDFLKHEGKGHYIGTVLLAQGLVPDMTEFFEGDDSTYVDGTMRMHGTGSEDYFNGGWYAVLDRWDRACCMPVHGCLDYSLQNSRSGGYRFFLSDKLSFINEFYSGIEHGPVGNDWPTDYTSVAYYYGEEPSIGQMSPSADLREAYTPDSHTFFPQAMNLSLGENVRAGFVRDVIECRSEGTGVIRVMLDDVEEGKYWLYVNYGTGPDGAEFSVWQRHNLISDWESSKSEADAWVRRKSIGVIDVTPQNNSISFKIRGDGYRNVFVFGKIFLESVK